MDYYVLETKKIFETDVDGYRIPLSTPIDRSAIYKIDTIEKARQEMMRVADLIMIAVEKSHDRAYRAKENINEIIIYAENNTVIGSVITEFFKLEVGWL